jgi:hypothetical protein
MYEIQRRFYSYTVLKWITLYYNFETTYSRINYIAYLSGMSRSLGVVVIGTPASYAKGT